MRYFLRLFLPLFTGVAFAILTLALMVKYPNQIWDVQNPLWSIDFEVMLEPVLRSENSTILVCVTSAPPNTGKRHAIRETWATTRGMRVVFMMGVPQGEHARRQQQSIDVEGARYGDVVQLRFHEHHKNLTLKSVGLVQWAVRARWKGRRLVVKVDDDTFVNTPLLLKHLEDFTDGSMYGRYVAKPTKNTTRATRPPRHGSRRNTRKKGILPNKFPPYLLGLFYVFTERALDRIYKSMFAIPLILVEDIYITGLVAEKAGVPRCQLPQGTSAAPDSPRNTTLARFDNGLLAQHYCGPGIQRRYWKHVARNVTS